MEEKQAPDVSGDIQSLTSKYSNEWARCSQPNDDGGFCRAVVREMNARNPKFGLNAKRDGSSDDISKDAIAYYRGPTDRHVEVYDFIVGHEASGARIGWGDVTDYKTMGNAGTARFVHPVTGGGFSDDAPVPPTEDGMITLDEAVRRLNAGISYTLTQEIMDKIAVKARGLGWDGGSMIAASIIAQIITDLEGTPIPIPSSSIVCKVTEAGGVFPVGTTVKILVG